MTTAEEAIENLQRQLAAAREDLKDAEERTAIAIEALKDVEDAVGSEVVKTARQLLEAEPSARNAALALEQIGASESGNK